MRRNGRRRCRLSFPFRFSLFSFIFWATALIAQPQALSPVDAPAQLKGKTLSGRLTLAKAEQLAVQNHPFISSATLSAEAAKNIVDQARSSYYPTAAVNVTSAVANDGTVLAAGLLQTSSLSTRFASGVSILQLVTDFGRTGSLVNAAKFRYETAEDNVLNARAQILLAVRRAYFGVLG